MGERRIIHYPQKRIIGLYVDIMGTAVVLIILIAIVGVIIKSMIRDKKNGKSISCGGDCKNCGGHCH